MWYDETEKKYEVIAWTDAKNPQMPCYQEQFRSKDFAIKQARSISKRYPLVEVNAIKVDANDENNLLEGKFLHSWTNGKKTA